MLFLYNFNSKLLLSLVVVPRLFSIEFDRQGFVCVGGLRGAARQVRRARALPAVALSDSESLSLAVQSAGRLSGAQRKLLWGEEIVGAVAVQNPVLRHALTPRPSDRVTCALTEGFAQIAARRQESFKVVETD